MESTIFEVEEAITDAKSKQIVINNNQTQAAIFHLRKAKFISSLPMGRKEGFSTSYCSGNMSIDQQIKY